MILKLLSVFLLLLQERGHRSAMSLPRKKESRSEERLLREKIEQSNNDLNYDCLRRNATSEARPPKPAKASVAGSGTAFTVNGARKLSTST